MKTKWVVVSIMVCSLFVAGLAGCAPVQAPAAIEMRPEAGKITVVNLRARPAPLAEGNGAVYFSVLNGLDRDVQLQDAGSAAAAQVELHETIDDNGVMRMEHRPEGFTVPAGGHVELAPGGKHVMLMGLAEPLEVGDEIEMTLSFDNGESMIVTAPVVEIDDKMPAKMEHGG